MHAGVMRVEFGDVDRGATFVSDKIVPSARQQPGIVAADWLAERGTDRGLAATIWEGEAAMLAADATAREASRTERKDGTVDAAMLEVYEVVAHL